MNVCQGEYKVGNPTESGSPPPDSEAEPLPSDESEKGDANTSAVEEAGVGKGGRGGGRKRKATEVFDFSRDGLNDNGRCVGREGDIRRDPPHHPPSRPPTQHPLRAISLVLRSDGHLIPPSLPTGGGLSLSTKEKSEKRPPPLLPRRQGV